MLPYPKPRLLGQSCCLDRIVFEYDKSITRGKQTTNFTFNKQRNLQENNALISNAR